MQIIAEAGKLRGSRFAVDIALWYLSRRLNGSCSAVAARSLPISVVRRSTIIWLTLLASSYALAGLLATSSHDRMSLATSPLSLKPRDHTASRPDLNVFVYPVITTLIFTASMPLPKKARA
jgi:hypothetical protein